MVGFCLLLLTENLHLCLLKEFGIDIGMKDFFTVTVF